MTEQYVLLKDTKDVSYSDIKQFVYSISTVLLKMLYKKQLLIDLDKRFCSI
jgi:hypothetical protein